MGVPSNSLGVARASIEFDLSQLQAGVAAARQAGAQMQAAFQQVNTGTRTAEASVGSFSDAFRTMGRTVGIAGGIMGAIQIGRMVEDLAQAAANADRVRSAFDTLASSAGRSSETWMASMQRASRGMISDNNLVLSSNKAMLLGVADSGEEMGQLLEVARVRGQAMGLSASQAFDNIVTGIGRMSPRILDNLGIVIDDTQAFKKYAESINTTADKLTDAQKRIALFNAVIADSAPLVAASGSKAESSADKFDKLTAATDNAKKAAGEFILAAGAPGVWDNLTKGLEGDILLLRALTRGFTDARKAAEDFFKPVRTAVSGDDESVARRGIAGAESERDSLLQRRAFLASDTSAGKATAADLAAVDARLKDVNQQLSQFHAALALATGGVGAGSSPYMRGVARNSGLPAVNPNEALQNQDKAAWFEAAQKIDRDAGQARLDATQQYESARSETVYSYEQGIAREEQDFGISRVRQAADLADNIARIGLDSSRQAAKWAEDLADSIAQMTEDSGKRLADAQETSAKRINEINEQYAKNREKALRDHNDNLLDAAANLDAKAVFNEQKAFARSSADAKDAHDTALAKESEGLAERSAKEAENLAERIQQAQEANAKQLADAKEADALRIQDAKDALAKQQIQEDEDRALRLARGAEDQAHQLAQMDIAQGERLAQIDKHAAEERAALDADFLKQLDEDGLRNAKWYAQQQALKALALKQFDEFWTHMLGAFGKQNGPISQADKDQFIDPTKLKGFADGGPIRQTGAFWGHAGEVVLNKSIVDRMGGFAGVQQMAMAGGRGHTLNLSDGAITINAAPGMNTYDIAHAVRREVLDIFNNELA